MTSLVVVIPLFFRATTPQDRLSPAYGVVASVHDPRRADVPVKRRPTSHSFGSM
jgi:hypothetical protein